MGKQSRKQLRRELRTATHELAQAQADLARIEGDLVRWRDTKTRYVAHLEEESGVRHEDRWGTTTRAEPLIDEPTATINLMFVGDGGEPCFSSLKIPLGGGVFFPLAPHPIMERLHGFMVRAPQHPLPKEELIGESRCSNRQL